MPRIRATRRTQPYRKGPTRPKGPTLTNMKRGKTPGLQHPMATRRTAQRRARRGRKNRLGFLTR